MTKRYYDMALHCFLIITAIVLGILITTAIANAASLQVCWERNSNPDIIKAPVFLDGNPFVENALEGSTVDVPTMKACNQFPIPGTLLRGQDFTVTMRYVNTVGEVSAPSNGRSFRNPNLPPVPVITDVSVVAP